MDDVRVELTPGDSLWDRVFTIAPLVLVGTREADGHDLAPKHMAMPIGWGEHYCFVCRPEHATHANVVTSGEFTVSYPRPEQVVLVGQAAAPRVEGEKASLVTLPTVPASVVDGVLVEGAAIHLECRLDRVEEGFGPHSLIIGRVVAASAASDAVRLSDADDAEILRRSPVLGFVSPNRYAPIGETLSFPFPLDFRR